MKRFFLALLLFLSTTVIAAGVPLDKALVSSDLSKFRPAINAEKVGKEVMKKRALPAFEGKVEVTESGYIWRTKIHHPGASYICPHFQHFSLPDGAYLEIRSHDGERTWRYEGNGKGDMGIRGGFWAIHIPGETAILELYSPVALPAGAVEIDRYARGFSATERKETQDRAICGSDDSEWAKCYQTSEPEIYNKSRAVVRLLLNGAYACTGWLVGDEGHVMTNAHCIDSASTAANTNFEFMAEGSTCGTYCNSWGACPGTVVATSSSLVKLSNSLDYALVRLPTNPTGTYGFLQMRQSGASQGERIYIPQHPAHWGKRIAVYSSASPDTSGYSQVYSLNETPCSGGPGDVGYFADTQGGSSGSPVIGYQDHLVVALHHCANCPNRGVPIDAVISDLGAAVPNNAIGGGVVPPPPPPDNELQNGVPVTNLSGVTGQEEHYMMTVPTGASDLLFRISGGSGDADIYVKFGSAPTTSSWDYRPYLSGNEETVSIPSPASGVWYVMIRAYASYSGVALQGSFVEGGGGGIQTSTLDGSIMGRESIYFDLTVSGGLINQSLTWDTSNDLDLYLYDPQGKEVARGISTNKPETLSYDTRGVGGMYSMRVFNYSNVSTATNFTLTTTYQP